MRVKYSLRKDAINRREHGISLNRAEEFDLDTAVVTVDDSQDYGEVRYIGTGFLGAAIYILVFTQIDDTSIRAISLRKAVPSERASYAEH